MVRARALHHAYQASPEQGLMQLRADGASEDAQDYYSALMSAERGDVFGSLSALALLADSHPDLALLPATAAEIAMKGGQAAEAIQRSEHILRLMPNYIPAMLLLAEAKLHSAPAESYELFTAVTQVRPQSISAHRLLAEAAGRSGHHGWGHLAKAEALQLEGRIDEALRQLSYSLELAETSGDRRLQAQVESRQGAYEDYQEAIEVL
jgi:predicted Zn-dependent protease